MPSLRLSFESKNQTTFLRVLEQQPPWRVVRGFRVPSGETLAHVHNLSGGILDSDALHWSIDAGPQAQAQVTSTGATRVYRSRCADRVASQSAEIRLGEGAYLEYLPDQLIPFAGSRFEQTARVELAHGASLIWWDRVSPGREASGEIFKYESLSSSLTIAAAGEPVTVERWTLTPAARDAGSIARLGPFRHFASCYVCRAGQSGAYWREFESRMESVTQQFSRPELLWGVTCLRAHGLVIRGVSTSGRSLSDSLVELWKAAKWFLCGRVATLPRKIH
jgi:urease accessory protein